MDKSIAQLSLQTNEDDRQFPRYPVLAYAERLNGDSKIRHPVQNISLGGICLQGELTEEVGTQLELALYAPELEHPFMVKGEVVWANRSEPKDMGVRFVEVPSESQQELQRYIERISSHLQESLDV